ncbi:MAG: bifunctional DNA-binding transcriptional regulator/O6-methylguanine-DNA methyltransferase Ada [Acidobacteriaceae bacterium]|nr:bifunctional DNA-binding transcriptional regulator/O6-methylguanine-DNA methyltransferase Ada [Acidobacteriaceae bacterium]
MSASFAAGLLPMSSVKKTPPPAFSGKAWQQVLTRDASADGQFVYAVKSTGVYCRPSCPSRRPERKNVSFFRSPAEAEAAGFRACQRCEPQRQQPKADPQAAAVEQACDLLRTGERIEMEELAARVGLSRFALSRAFDRVLGVSPGEFARSARRERFAQTVREPRRSVTEAVYEAGYSSPSRVYEDVSLGMTPSTMKAGGRGETLHWATAETSFGTVLAASTERGLCAVLFADSSAEAAAELRERFPQAALRQDEEKARNALDAALTQLQEPVQAVHMPLDVRATAFQQRVWEALRRIPRGETRTYAQIAEEIGAPRSVRAVGTACGANPLAVVVPCHRVVGARGELTGYRWGKERKKQLLEMEQQ